MSKEIYIKIVLARKVSKTYYYPIIKDFYNEGVRVVDLFKNLNSDTSIINFNALYNAFTRALNINHLRDTDVIYSNLRDKEIKLFLCEGSFNDGQLLWDSSNPEDVSALSIIKEEQKKQIIETFKKLAKTNFKI